MEPFWAPLPSALALNRDPGWESGGAGGVPAPLSPISQSPVSPVQRLPLPAPHDGHHPPPLQRSLAPFCALAAGVRHLPPSPWAPAHPSQLSSPAWVVQALSTLGNQTMSPPPRPPTAPEEPRSHPCPPGTHMASPYPSWKLEPTPSPFKEQNLVVLPKDPDQGTPGSMEVHLGLRLLPPRPTPPPSCWFASTHPSPLTWVRPAPRQRASSSPVFPQQRAGLGPRE